MDEAARSENLGLTGNPQGGDIILSAPDSGKSRKGLVIVLVVLVVLAALVGGGVVLWRSGVLGGENAGSSNSIDLTQEFNKYANYLLYGQSTSDAINGKFEKYSVYSIEEAFDNNDLDYANNLEEYWKVFYSLWSEKELYDSGIINNQNDLMNFWIYYVRMGNFSDEELLNLFLSDGKDETYEKIEQRYNGVDEIKYEPGVAYINAEKRRAKAATDLYEQYWIAGCITDSSLSAACVESVNIPVETLQNYIDAEESVMSDFMGIVMSHLVNNCWLISEQMGGK